MCAADVLFNRKARLSSNVSPGTRACTGVDGEVRFFSFRTADYDKEPYWEVDMEAIYTTMRLKIYWRPIGCKTFLTLDGLMSRPCKWMSMILSNVLSVTCSFILRSYQLKMLAGVGEGGGGGGWRQGVLCYTHMFCSLFHTQEPFRRSLGIILCCCILFYFHAPII